MKERKNYQTKNERKNDNALMHREIKIDEEIYWFSGFQRMHEGLRDRESAPKE